MWTKTLIAGTLAGALFGVAASASAEPDADGRRPCNHWRAIAEQLDEKFNERPVAAGLQTNGNLVQLFVAEDTGTWSMVIVRPSGVGCLVSAGEGWQAVSQKIDGPAA